MSVKMQLIDRIKWSMSVTIRPKKKLQLTEIATAHSDVIKWLVEHDKAENIYLQTWLF